MTSRPTGETIRLEDMRLFAAVAAARSFTAAARSLGIPKQTLSRRISELEATLRVRLLYRTTRRLHVTDVGAAYAERCAEIARLADEANRAITDAAATPRGLLRVTADPELGESFLAGIALDYARRYPEVELEILLTRRRVRLVEEGFDLALRVGWIEDGTLIATRLGPARVRYCASGDYLRRRGTPHTPADLAHHDCLLVLADDVPQRWPFRGRKGPVLHAVAGRLRFNSVALARAAALAGLGIALFPEFLCVTDLRSRRLRSVLDDYRIDAGAVWLVQPAGRYLATRVRAFAELAIAAAQHWEWERPPQSR
jgi:DNA-binding transcriptional LysR family regulator